MAGRIEHDIVNGLIEICRDGAQGFRQAADSVADPELKRIFIDTARRREVYAAELLPFARSLGVDGTARGAWHRRWMAVKDVLTDHDESSVLAEAIRGELAAAAVYAGALVSMLPPNARPIVQRQHDEIRGVLGELNEFALPCI